MSYIDGFVIAVPTANKATFIVHARKLDPIFIELGAIRVIGGEVMSPMAKLPTRKRWLFRGWNGRTRLRRDAAMKKMMKDQHIDPSTPCNPLMPLDGFEQVVEVWKLRPERNEWHRPH